MTPLDDRLPEIGADQTDEFWQQAGLDALLEARHGRTPSRPGLWEDTWKEIERREGTAVRRRKSWSTLPRPDSGGSRRLWIAAAALLFGLLVLLSLPSEGPERRERITSTRPQPPAPAPERPPVRVPERPPAPVEQPRVVTPPTPAPPRETPKEEPKTEAPKVEEKPAPPAPPPPPAVKPTVVATAVARLGRVEGEATITHATGRRPARTGDSLASGEGLETKGAAAIVYPDGTRLELAKGAVRDLSDAKRLLLDGGTIAAEVPKQERPLVLVTPQAEARVLGTTFTLAVDATSTRLDVSKGKVRLTRLSDGASTDVAAGQFAVASATVAPGARAIPPKPVVFLSETFEDPRAVDARWKRSGILKTAGRLEIDLSARGGEGSWKGGGLQSKQTFALPLAFNADVEIPELHAGVVVAVVFVPQGQARGGEGVFRLQLRGNRYGLLSEKGEAKELAGADRPGAGPCRERWRIEIDGGRVRWLVDGRDVLSHAHGLPVGAGYGVELDGSARSDAPSGAKAAFDAVVIELLRP